jgi:hypothetical protein
MFSDNEVAAMLAALRRQAGISDDEFAATTERVLEWAASARLQAVLLELLIHRRISISVQSDNSIRFLAPERAGE